MAADVWADIYPWIVAGLGGFFGAALLDILVGAQVEQQMDHQHRQSGIGWEKRSDLLENGEAMFAALDAAANQRLFREESNGQQRSRP